MNDIYLCIQQNKFGITKCKKFNDYIYADRHYLENYQNKNIYFSTMIPICKFNPFKKTVLRYELSKILIKLDI